MMEPTVPDQGRNKGPERNKYIKVDPNGSIWAKIWDMFLLFMPLGGSGVPCFLLWWWWCLSRHLTSIYTALMMVGSWFTRLPNPALLFYSGLAILKSALTQMAMAQIKMTAVSPVSPHYNIPRFIFPAITAKAAHLSHIHAVLATTSFLQAGTPAKLCGRFRASYKAGYKADPPPAHVRGLV